MILRLWTAALDAANERKRVMENSICISKTLLTKQHDREIYWCFSRWHGQAKMAFVIGLCVDVASFFLLCVFTGFLLFDPYAGREIGYILLCISCWILSVIFILLTVFQGHIYANKCDKPRRQMNGRKPVYAETEFYSDHFVIKSGVFGEVRSVPYSIISGYTETAHYCVLITSAGTFYTYGVEEFIQGSADEVYALVTQYLNREFGKG